MANIGLVKHSPDIPASNFQVLLFWFYFHICLTAMAMPVHRGKPTEHTVDVVVVVSSPHQWPRCGVSRFRSAQSIAIPLSVWSASISPAHIIRKSE